MTNRTERLYDISGSIMPWMDVLIILTCRMRMFGIDLGRVGGPITARNVMRTEGRFLCYKYV